MRENSKLRFHCMNVMENHKLRFHCKKCISSILKMKTAYSSKMFVSNQPHTITTQQTVPAHNPAIYKN